MKRVLILMMLCGACTGPVLKDDGGPTQRVSFSSSTEFQKAPAPRFDVDLRPQKEQDLETIGRNR